MTDFERLKEIRKKLTLNQKNFSNALGMTQGAYSDVERGRKSISYNLLNKLADIFHISPNWIIKGQGDIHLRNPKDNSLAKQEGIESEKGKKVIPYTTDHASFSVLNEEPFEGQAAMPDQAIILLRSIFEELKTQNQYFRKINLVLMKHLGISEAEIEAVMKEEDGL
jgi:transcriptional regulator with XRE-family HTH domain